MIRSRNTLPLHLILPLPLSFTIASNLYTLSYRVGAQCNAIVLLSQAHLINSKYMFEQQHHKRSTTIHSCQCKCTVSSVPNVKHTHPIVCCVSRLKRKQEVKSWMLSTHLTCPAGSELGSIRSPEGGNI